jgi:tetratricopeptide (TPR) repeat protein
MLGCAHLCRGFVAREPAALARAIPPMLRAVALDPAHLPAFMVLGGAYLVRGQHSHARLPIDRALELERRGAGLAFLGARVQRAVLHLGADELDAAALLLDEAVAVYTGSDHVYAETMSAYAHCIRGALGERLGRLDAALADCTRACEIADANEHRIAIGAHWVKGRCGMARVLHRLGRADEAAGALADGQALFASRERFVWTWIHGATDVDVLYEVAAALATLGRADEALDTLRVAAGAGWADVPTLRHDPAFATLRDAAATMRICTDAASTVALAPRVGSGGLG